MGPVNPECRNNKHGNCNLSALDVAEDRIVACHCYCHRPLCPACDKTVTGWSTDPQRTLTLIPCGDRILPAADGQTATFHEGREAWIEVHGQLVTR